MINSITGNYTFVDIRQSGSAPYVNISQPSAGLVRYNPTYQRMEVYDGNMWVTLGMDTHVDLSPNAREVIEWAGKKMDEEKRWRDMAEKNPAIRDAYEKFKQAEEQLKIVEALVKE